MRNDPLRLPMLIVLGWLIATMTYTLGCFVFAWSFAPLAFWIVGGLWVFAVALFVALVSGP